MTFGSLFSGCGMLDLGLERAGLKCKWQVEIDDYATRVLEKLWPNLPRFRDVREFPPSPYDQERAGFDPSVDVLAGGFPCTDISYAGAGAGIDGDQSGLWREYFRIIRILRPKFVLVENVPALLGRGLSRVLGNLADVGFDAEWSCVSACSMGATHVRQRLFIVAYANGINGREGIRDSIARAFRALQTFDGFASARACSKARLANPSELYRGADGLAFGSNRNRCIGNGVYPDVPQWNASRILDAERQVAQ